MIRSLRPLRWYALLAALVLSCPTPTPAQTPAPAFSAHELDSLVAPIALYPDGVLANVLMAATYPLDVVAAVRWLNQPGNAVLQGATLSAALDGQDWDPSVKALIATPQVLRMMDTRLDWMERLGDAFVAGQGPVMDAVQHLRHQARATGQLRTNSERRVIERDGDILIEPASSQLAIEVYEPMTAYGSWQYPDYPPVYFTPPPEYLAAPIFIYPIYGPLWGWSRWDWRRHRLHLDVPRWRDLDRHHSHVIVGNTWEHEPGRHGFHGGSAGGPHPVLPGLPPTQAVITPGAPGTATPTPGDPRRGPGRFGRPAPHGAADAPAGTAQQPGLGHGRLGSSPAPAPTVPTSPAPATRALTAPALTVPPAAPVRPNPSIAVTTPGTTPAVTPGIRTLPGGVRPGLSTPVAPTPGVPATGLAPRASIVVTPPANVGGTLPSTTVPQPTVPRVQVLPTPGLSCPPGAHCGPP